MSVRHIHPQLNSAVAYFCTETKQRALLASGVASRVAAGKNPHHQIPSGRPPTLRKKQSKHKNGSQGPPTGARSAGDCGEEVGASSPRTPVPLSLFLSSASSLPRPLR